MRIAPQSEAALLWQPVPPPVTWREFYECRNSIVRALAAFGTVGPSGTIDTTDEEADWRETDISSVTDPDYFVVEDRYDDHQRWHRVETDRTKLTASMIEGVASALMPFPGWFADVAVGDSKVMISADRVIPFGRRFWDCESVEALADQAAKRLDYGAAPDFWLAGYELWRELVCDQCTGRSLPRPPNRQWEAVFSALPRDRPFNRFHYTQQIRYELHPQTRSQHVRRFLDEFRSSDAPTGIQIVAEEIGMLMVELAPEPARADTLANLTEAQRTLARVDRQGAFLLWSSVQYGIQLHPEASLRSPAAEVLSSHLRELIHFTDSDVVRLSALLGLANLRSPDAQSYASRLASQQHWPGAFDQWLDQLSRCNSVGLSFPLEFGDLT